MAATDDDHEFQASEPAAPPPARPAPAAPPWEADACGFLDAVLGSMAEIVVVVDAHGDVVRVNRASRAQMPWLTVGMSARELDERVPLFAADDQTRIPSADLPIARVLRGETLEPTEYVVAPPDRPRIVLSISGAPLYQDDRLTGAVLVSHDITHHKRAEAHFRAIFEASAPGISLQDAEGHFAATNPSLRRLLGYSEAELARMTAADLTDPEEYAHERMKRQQLLAGEIDRYEQVMRVRARDGRRLWVTKSVSRFPVVGDEVGLVLCLALDITARVEAEAALRGSEARLRALVESAPAVVAVCDLDFRYQYINRRPSGLPEDALIGRNSLEHLLPAYVPLIERARDEVVQTRQARQLEVQVNTPEGEAHWYDVTLGPIVEGEAVVALVSLSVDVTARHRALERLADHEELLAAAERSASLGSWRLDVRTGEVAWSDGMYRLLGYEPRAIAPSVEAYMARLHPAQRAALWYDEAAVRAGLVPPGEDHQIIRADGEERVLRFTGRLEHDAAGQPLRAIGVAQDVTEHVRAERAKADFLAVVSHEMRTPLTIIRAPLLMIQRGVLDAKEPQGQAVLDLAVQGVERMTRLVDDIHDLHRLESGNVTMRLAAVDGAALVAGAVDAMRPIAAQAGVRLAAGTSSLLVRADQDRAVQVLTNLIENAIKYSPSGGTVHVEVVRRDPVAEFSVSDEGSGIPEDQREAIFGRYVQLGAKSTRPSSGIGLGLAIAQDIVTFHGGRIWVEPRPGGGSVFRFTLPLAPAASG